MNKKLVLAAVAALVGVTGVMAAMGKLPLLKKAGVQAANTTDIKKPAGPPALAVTVNRVEASDFIETVLVTGSLVPREEILVGPEVEGLRVIEVLADEGQRVTKDQVLARLVSDTLEAQLAQNDASLARAGAAIAQALSNITSAEARVTEAQNALNRGKPLAKSGYLSESGMDQREATAKTAAAALAVARDSLTVAQAEKAQVEAQRRELSWRRGRTEVRAPADGLISRRVARIGGYATGASDPMFRIVAKGEIELDAEIVETRLGKLKVGQPVEVDAAGGGKVKGTLRLISAEIDKATRLGRVRIFIGENPALRIGSFARGTIETSRSRGLSVPTSSLLYSGNTVTVQVVTAEGRIATRAVKIGLEQGAAVEIRDGLTAGDLVVVKSGTFLRDGDAVRPILGDAQRVSTAG